jgi:hypothetical protein
VALQPDKVLAEIISPSTRPTATANIVGMINSTATSFRVIAQTRFDLPLYEQYHLRVSRTIEGELLHVEAVDVVDNVRLDQRNVPRRKSCL